MSKVLGIDFETTGLNTAEDAIIEVGAVVWDWPTKTPLEMYSEFVLPRKEKLPITDEIVKITGIRQEWLELLGVSFLDAAVKLHSMCLRHKIEYVFAHNGENFDRPLFKSEAARCLGGAEENHPLVKLPWIDTRSDLPHASEPESRRLRHLALDAGFINPFEHRAVFDVLTMMKVAGDFDLQEIIAMSKVPWVTVRALVDYDNREKAKELRFSWEKIGDKTYPKMWVKKIRENQLSAEMERAEKLKFKIVRLD